MDNGRVRYHPERYKDKHGKHKSLSPARMVDYILNIYKTLMTRGIRGTFVYACDPQLSSCLAGYIPVYQQGQTGEYGHAEQYEPGDQSAEAAPGYGVEQGED